MVHFVLQGVSAPFGHPVIGYNSRFAVDDAEKLIFLTGDLDIVHAALLVRLLDRSRRGRCLSPSNTISGLSFQTGRYHRLRGVSRSHLARDSRSPILSLHAATRLNAISVSNVVEL